MPIYEYKCADCGEIYEALIRGASDVPVCPKCDSKNATRRMSAPASPHSNSSASTPCGRDCGGEHSHSCGCAGACHCHG